MDEIRVKRTFDHELLTKIYLSDDIFEIGAEDGVSKKGFRVPQIYAYKNICLTAYVNNEIAGSIIFENITNVTFAVHINILEKYRHTNTAQLANLAKDWLFKNINARQIVAFVSAHRKDVTKLAEKCNLKCCGLIKNGFLKNGTLHDVIIFQLEK